MENTVKLELEFDTTVEEGNIPRLKVLENGEETRLYVYPFRGYKMQVTSENGSGDYGSSEVIGYGNLLKAVHSFNNERSNRSVYASNVDRDGMFKAVIKSAVYEAMAKYAYRYGNRREDKIAYVACSMNTTDEIHEFSKAVLEWIISIK